MHNIAKNFLSSLPPIQSPQLPTTSPVDLAIASAHAVASCALLELSDTSLVGSEPQANNDRVAYASSIASSVLFFGDGYECQDVWIVTGVSYVVPETHLAGSAVAHTENHSIILL